MRLIDGRAIAATIADQIAAEVTGLRTANGTTPTLAVLVPTADAMAARYGRAIQRAAASVGVGCRVERLGRPHPQEIAARLEALSADPDVHGLICQAPLPAGLTMHQVGAHIDPAKDVDGANPVSLGRLAAGLPTFAPATAEAVLEVLRHERVELAGAEAVVLGRSATTGKPAALLLLAAHATVTICHSYTPDLAQRCARARVLVTAVGRARMIGADHIRPGATVIDVGLSPTVEGGLVGDVDPDAAAGRAAALTPVPGGLGPVTTMILLRHTVAAARSLSAVAVAHAGR